MLFSYAHFENYWFALKFCQGTRFPLVFGNFTSARLLRIGRKISTTLKQPCFWCEFRHSQLQQIWSDYTIPFLYVSPENDLTVQPPLQGDNILLYGSVLQFGGSSECKSTIYFTALIVGSLENLGWSSRLHTKNWRRPQSYKPKSTGWPCVWLPIDYHAPLVCILLLISLVLQLCNGGWRCLNQLKHQTVFSSWHLLCLKKRRTERDMRRGRTRRFQYTTGL